MGLVYIVKQEKYEQMVKIKPETSENREAEIPGSQNKEENILVWDIWR